MYGNKERLNKKKLKLFIDYFANESNFNGIGK